MRMYSETVVCILEEFQGDTFNVVKGVPICTHERGAVFQNPSDFEGTWAVDLASFKKLMSKWPAGEELDFTIEDDKLKIKGNRRTAGLATRKPSIDNAEEIVEMLTRDMDRHPVTPELVEALKVAKSCCAKGWELGNICCIHIKDRMLEAFNNDKAYRSPELFDIDGEYAFEGKALPKGLEKFQEYAVLEDEHAGLGFGMLVFHGELVTQAVSLIEPDYPDIGMLFDNADADIKVDMKPLSKILMDIHSVVSVFSDDMTINFGEGSIQAGGACETGYYKEDHTIGGFEALGGRNINISIEAIKAILAKADFVSIFENRIVSDRMGHKYVAAMT